MEHSIRSTSSDPNHTPTSVIPLPFEGPQPTGRQPTNSDPDNLDQNPRCRRIHHFTSRFLHDPRDLILYLPQAYLTDPARHFPVFYLHDGQNLFDPHTSYLPGRTWRAHTTADTLTAAGRIEPVILVGINNTGIRRMPEYTPTRDPHLGGGDGPLYGRLLVHELKPLIDTHLRTLPGAPNTALGGSSLGGLISLALGLAYPQIFSKLAVLSPSVWWNDRAILRAVGNSQPPSPTAKIWLDIGTAEGHTHVNDCDLLARRLEAKGYVSGQTLQYLRVPNAEHNEDAWAARFGQVLEFLFPPR